MSIGPPEILMGLLVVVLVLVIVAIGTPPNRWVEWFSGKGKDKK